MGLKLFEYAVVKQPLKKDGEIIDDGEIVVEVSTVLAKDETQVQLLAARQIPDAEIEDLDRLEVVVRPF
jgi:hypothetical protein